MLQRLRVGRASTGLLALYLACVALVFSFILFEVLDIDGSDFPAPMRTVTPPHVAEASHDIKRACLAGHGQLDLDLHPPVGGDAGSLALRLQRVALLATTVGSAPVAFAFRVTLARSSLDAPASA